MPRETPSDKHGAAASRIEDDLPRTVVECPVSTLRKVAEIVQPVKHMAAMCYSNPSGSARYTRPSERITIDSRGKGSGRVMVRNGQQPQGIGWDDEQFTYVPAARDDVRKDPQMDLEALIVIDANTQNIYMMQRDNSMKQEIPSIVLDNS